MVLAALGVGTRGWADRCRAGRSSRRRGSTYEEHHVADVLCFELATMSPDDEHFDAKVIVLAESVTHHIDEEENDWFPKVREGLGRKQLQELGARMEELRPKAPRKPTEPKALKSALDAMRA